MRDSGSVCVSLTANSQLESKVVLAPIRVSTRGNSHLECEKVAAATVKPHINCSIPARDTTHTVDNYYSVLCPKNIW